MPSDAVQRDRELIAALGLSAAEAAMLCDQFHDSGLQLYGCFLSLGGPYSHRDRQGRVWQVDGRELARRLSQAGLEQRRALNRAVFRFWENYPSCAPAEAMRTAGLF